jgi:CubicO group peptidase (beta-lactamase class C family)
VIHYPHPSVRLFFAAIVAAACCCGLPPQLSARQPPSQADDLQERLGVLREKLEAERNKLHIPGMAIAIVKDDEVIFAEGFGQSDVDRASRVTAETLFAVGSTTKAFTSTLIGMLADDGVMQFDDAVTQHLPDFQLAVDTGGEDVTIRDLLSHRTGFSRMGILWAAGRATRPEVIQYAAMAEPFKQFRKEFQYNNVMYMAAGYAAGQATGSTWESLIAERIFAPLGMTSSNTSVEQSRQDARLAEGYDWDKDKQEYKHREMRNLDLIGPAGSINSNVVDMAQWVRFQLARGEFNGKRLISAERLAETWEQQIEIAPSIGYGMGWMLRDWQGRKVVEHGGNIDGFSAQVTLLPEENLGYVLLANVTATPLQSLSIGLVFDTLLGEPDSEGDNLTGINTDGLLGKYVANFGPFVDQRFTVSLQEGKLHIDVPGQMNFELKAPGEDGKWPFALTDQIAVSFDKDENGQARSLTMYQAGFEFECMREGVQREPEIPLDQITPLLGRYHDPDNDITVRIIVHNNRLAAQVEGQGPMEFLPPDEDGRWAMAAKPEQSVLRFNRDDNGRVTSVVRTNRAGEETEMPRLEDTEETLMISTEALLEKIVEALGDASDFSGNVKMEGTVNFVHQGARGTVQTLVSGRNRHATRIDVGKLGYIHEAYNGQDGWSDSAFAPFEELSGDKLAVLRHKHPLWLAGNWQEDYQSVAVIGDGEHEGQRVFHLRFTSEDLPDRTLHVAAESGLVLKEETAIIAEGIGQLPVSITYSDFRDIAGLRLPFCTRSENSQTGATVIQYESASQPAEIPAEQFTLQRPE